MDSQELYCKIYLNTNRDRAWLLQELADQCRGVLDGRTVNSSELVVDVSRNEDYDPTRAQDPDGFVYFRYYLDVLPADGIERTPYIEAIRRLLLFFLQMDISAVASCDFESELPSPSGEPPHGSGGAQRIP